MSTNRNPATRDRGASGNVRAAKPNTPEHKALPVTTQAAPSARVIAFPNSLADLAARIRAEHEGVTAAIRRGLEHALRAGDLLIEAKGKVPHGQWLPWLAEHVAIPERTARLYMRLADNRATIEQNGNVADLSINRALKLLAAPPPKAPPPWNGVRIDVEKSMREEIAALVELVSPHGGERTPALADWLRYRRHVTGRWPIALDVIEQRVAAESCEAHRDLQAHGVALGLYSPWSDQDSNHPWSLERHKPEPERPPQVGHADAVAGTRLDRWRARQRAAKERAASALADKRSAEVIADDLVQEFGPDLARKVARAVNRQARIAALAVQHGGGHDRAN